MTPTRKLWLSYLNHTWFKFWQIFNGQDKTLSGICFLGLWAIPWAGLHVPNFHDFHCTWIYSYSFSIFLFCLMILLYKLLQKLERSLLTLVHSIRNQTFQSTQFLEMINLERDQISCASPILCFWFSYTVWSIKCTKIMTFKACKTVDNAPIKNWLFSWEWKLINWSAIKRLKFS